MLRHLHAAYREADRRTREFDRPQRRKVYGHMRLASIEQAFKLLCVKHTGLTAADVRAGDSSYEHFTINTEGLVITCSAVPAADKLPRHAEFRDTLASGVGYSLFPEPPDIKSRRFFHVLLLHSYERRFEFDPKSRTAHPMHRYDLPGFCEMAVPTRDGLGRLLSLNLFTLHAETLAEIRGLTKVDVETKRPTRRPQRTSATSSEGSSA